MMGNTIFAKVKLNGGHNMTEKLFEYEKEIFAKSIKKELSLNTERNYYVALDKAFDDAFNQYARRTRNKYASIKESLMEDVVKRLFRYFQDDKDNFEDCFEDCINKSLEILDNGKYGIAQKFVNMSFKYLYCFNDVEKYENKFRECNMPLDKYTIKWIKSLKDKEINKRLGEINDSWSRIERDLYKDIQMLISNRLKENLEYQISYKSTETDNKCVLPNNPLDAEFIIWHQEKINELHRILEKSKDDFERLGIVQI